MAISLTLNAIKAGTSD